MTSQLAQVAQDLFTTDMALPLLDTAELYGSKLVAAIDRQHPRHIIDVMKMSERFGWTPAFIDCFVAYIAGHNRPVHEVMFPRQLLLEPAFSNEFAGMTRVENSLESLEETQEQMISQLPQALTASHREFSALFGTRRARMGIDAFCPPSKPSGFVQWKLLNLRKLKTRNPDRFAAQHKELSERLTI